MKTNDWQLEDLIKSSGLKKPSDDFTMNTMNQIPQEFEFSESAIQQFLNRISWIVPAFSVLAGLIFIAISVPLPEFSLPTISFSFNFSDLKEFFFSIISPFTQNIYVSAGLAFLAVFFFVEMIGGKIRSLNLLV